MITLRNLRKRFAGASAPALDDISLDIASGEFFTLFGPSGCGKSTLLRCIAGLEHPDGGEITINGRTVFSTHTMVAPNQRRIGMVFQSYAIWPHMTVLENVAFPLQARKMPNVRERARAALAIVNLEHLEARYASMLSGGQQQRVALARAIVAEPAVLLLDEPLSNLDANLRDQMRAELQTLHQRTGLTTVYVTHDQTEALSMSDRIAVMTTGQCVEIGTPNQLFFDPTTSLTARLLGGANVFDGRAGERTAGLTAIDTSWGRLFSTTSASGLVSVFVHPDRITPGTETSGVNTFDCEVRARRFTGDKTELDLIHSSATTALRARVPSSLAIGLAQRIRVSIDPRDVRFVAKGA